MGTKDIGAIYLPSSLRQKTLLIIVLTMFAAVGSLFLLSRLLLLHGYARLEERFRKRQPRARRKRID